MGIPYILCVFLFLSGTEALHSEDFYTAAVFEHFKYDDPADKPGSIQRNLMAFEDAAKEAASKGADIIVFPEDAIMPSSGMKRTDFVEYYEEVPSPSPSALFNFCHHPSNTTGQTVVKKLSCIARNAGIYIAANIGEKESCSPANDTRCPSDIKKLFYNTDVVFDSNGTLVARHRKRFPFFEQYITRPKSPQYTVFNTSFGSFGVIICFDSMFVEAVEVVEKFGIENMIISTMWFDELPSISAIQYFQGWALGNKVNVLAANIHQPDTGTIGSLIISGTRGVLDYTFNPQMEKSKLLVTRVPRKVSVSSTPFKMEQRRLGGYFHTNTNFSIYTLKQLNKVSDSVSVCNNGLCCHLNYTTKSKPHDLYLGAFNGIRDISKHYFLCQEVCVVAVCETGSNCSRFPTHSDIQFDRVSLSGNIKTPHQYPSVLGSEMTLVPYHKWKFSPGQIGFESGEIDIPLLSVTINGRCYDRDPPFPDS